MTTQFSLSDIRDSSNVPLVLTLTGSNLHWTVTRPVNNLFTGRESILSKIEAVLRQGVDEPHASFQTRFVITGMGGQGKSEICLKLANSMRKQ